MKNTDVLVASHHGRENGICKEMFDIVGCSPVIVVVSDDYHQYDTQKTTQFYGSKTKGAMFGAEKRKVLTTRCDGEIHFDFTNRDYGWTYCTTHPSKPLPSATKPLPLPFPTLPSLGSLPRYGQLVAPPPESVMNLFAEFAPKTEKQPVSLMKLLAGLPPTR